MFRPLHVATGVVLAVAMQAAAASVPKNETDAKLGVSTFLWGNFAPSAVDDGLLKDKALREAQARAHLKSHAQELGIDAAAVDGAELTDVQDMGHGPVIARFKQKAAGYEVFNRRLNVMMNGAGDLVAISGYFAGNGFALPTSAPTFAQSPADAVTSVISKLGATIDASMLEVTGQKGAYQTLALNQLLDHVGLSRAVRVKPVLMPSNGALVPAYYLELWAYVVRENQDLVGLSGVDRGDELIRSYVVSAVDGSLLWGKNLVANEAYSYRVFADANGIHQPYASPLGTAGYEPTPATSPAQDLLPRVGATANLITLDHGPISTGDPWIADGGSTELTGNNAEAYLDDGYGVFAALVLPVSTPGDGYVPLTGDERVASSGANTFDYAIAADDDPSTDNAKAAAQVNLFYMNNWLHDWWYDHGFDETAGNAQASNYGRGGTEGDAILAEGQDASGRDNANMATPADGGAPRMQMYLFDGPIRGKVSITAPAELAGDIAFNGVEYGPQDFSADGDVAVANDHMGNPTDGCTGINTPPDPVLGLTQAVPNPVPEPALLGKIALIDRGGGCVGSQKALLAQVSGAKALLLATNDDGQPPFLVNGDIIVSQLISSNPPVNTNNVYQLPIVTISKADGQRIKDAIAAGATVSVHLERQHSIDYDGTIDEQVIAHEFFHHVSNRLVGDGSGLDNTQGGGMGEGWSDVNAMLMTVLPEQRKIKGNDKYQGAYPMGSYVLNSFYFGIRRTPYSTQFKYDPLTFKYIQEGVPLPTTAPIAFGTDGTGSSEVHSVGEIWAETMWECYAGLLNDKRHTFDVARGRMQDYVIAGLKMTPVSPTMTEARDGVLAAAMATDAKDFADCAAGFAKRGMGVNAVSPDRDSTDNAGVVEDFTGFTAPARALEASQSTSGSGTFLGAMPFGALLGLGLIGLGRRRRK